jgi:LmbE family N-acetylglucosaminyl deacetylase
MDIDFSRLKPVEPLKEPINILVTAAHHDDIEFGVAGSVARWVQEGAIVTYVIITDGGAGSNEPGVVREQLVERRRHEQMMAAAAVGVEDVRFLGYPDGTLQPTLDLRRDLTRIIREVKPYRVVTPDPTTMFVWDSYINHPDHRAAGEATVYAVFPSAETRPIFPELLAEGYEPHKVSELYLDFSFQATHYVDISATIDKKIEALRQHVSQLGEGEAFENGAAKWIKDGNAEWGQKVGVEYVEFFRVMRFNRENNENQNGAKSDGS